LINKDEEAVELSDLAYKATASFFNWLQIVTNWMQFKILRKS